MQKFPESTIFCHQEPTLFDVCCYVLTQLCCYGHLGIIIHKWWVICIGAKRHTRLYFHDFCYVQPSFCWERNDESSDVEQKIKYSRRDDRGKCHITNKGLPSLWTKLLGDESRVTPVKGSLVWKEPSGRLADSVGRGFFKDKQECKESLCYISVRKKTICHHHFKSCLSL